MRNCEVDYSIKSTVVCSFACVAIPYTFGIYILLAERAQYVAAVRHLARRVWPLLPHGSG